MERGVLDHAVLAELSLDVAVGTAAVVQPAVQSSDFLSSRFPHG
jgi:hypothetical protein